MSKRLDENSKSLSRTNRKGELFIYRSNDQKFETNRHLGCLGMKSSGYTHLSFSPYKRPTVTIHSVSERENGREVRSSKGLHRWSSIVNNS